MSIRLPYLLFLGDAPDPLAAKVAFGIRDWRPEHCIGQLRMAGCQADLGLTDMRPEQAIAAGARTLVVGVANRGGVISEAWVSELQAGMEAGLDLAAGLHNKLADVPALADTAARLGRKIHDVRQPQQACDVADGLPRTGKRLLTVGTDCSCGKMYTALALEKAMRARGIDADFRATGQTGILITGDGVSIDAVVADFISGAVEAHAPANHPAHWDLVEGQGSLFHVSFAGVSTGLLHGAQADALVLCHEPTRTHMRGLPHYPLPDLETCMTANLSAARLTNPAARFVGVSLNTSKLSDQAAADRLGEIESRTGLPTVDAVRTGVERIVDALV